MQYFSLHPDHGSHLGFLIMTAADESEQPPQSGQFLVKLQSETPPPADIARLLEPFTDSGSACRWQTEKTMSHFMAAMAASKAESATNTLPCLEKPSCSTT